jgi:hypothetical protein
MLILCIIAFVIYSAIGAQYGTSCEGYRCYEDKILDAVQDYQHKNDGALPVVNATVNISGYDYQIIDICALLTSAGGILSEVPVGLASVDSPNDDNCDAGCEGCHADFHYIWAVDEEGSVYSACVGANCSEYNRDDFQGVWP